MRFCRIRRSIVVTLIHMRDLVNCVYLEFKLYICPLHIYSYAIIYVVSCGDEQRAQLFCYNFCFYILNKLIAQHRKRERERYPPWVAVVHERVCVWRHSVSMFCRTLRVALRLRRAKQQGGIQQHRLFVYFIHFSKKFTRVHRAPNVCVCLFFLLPNTYFIISSHKSVLYIYYCG